MKISRLSTPGLSFRETTAETSRWGRAVRGVPLDAFSYACPQIPSPPKTETYQGLSGRVYEQSGKERPYWLFEPKDYDATKAYSLVLYPHHAGLAGTDSHNDTDWNNCVQLRRRNQRHAKRKLGTLQ
jgi:hypothetical protein